MQSIDDRNSDQRRQARCYSKQHPSQYVPPPPMSRHQIHPQRQKHRKHPLIVVCENCPNHETRQSGALRDCMNHSDHAGQHLGLLARDCSVEDEAAVPLIRHCNKANLSSDRSQWQEKAHQPGGVRQKRHIHHRHPEKHPPRPAQYREHGQDHPRGVPRFRSGQPAVARQSYRQAHRAPQSRHPEIRQIPSPHWDEQGACGCQRMQAPADDAPSAALDSHTGERWSDEQRYGRIAE
mmetsp:Transcript_69654/g.185505  ORF Transcript_69654/g.185505 Transcript_69654/m.185505 type:complete len:236 (-) Transcript_69654:1021-1728(-)